MLGQNTVFQPTQGQLSGFACFSKPEDEYIAFFHLCRNGECSPLLWSGPHFVDIDQCSLGRSHKLDAYLSDLVRMENGVAVS